MEKKFVPVKLNAEDKTSRVKIGERELTYAEAVGAYGVRGFPTLLFLEPNGQLIYALSGYKPKNEFMEIVQYIGERKFEDEQQGEGE